MGGRQRGSDTRLSAWGLPLNFGSTSSTGIPIVQWGEGHYPSWFQRQRNGHLTLSPEMDTTEITDVLRDMIVASNEAGRPPEKMAVYTSQEEVDDFYVALNALPRVADPVPGLLWVNVLGWDRERWTIHREDRNGCDSDYLGEEGLPAPEHGSASDAGWYGAGPSRPGDSGEATGLPPAGAPHWR